MAEELSVIGKRVPLQDAYEKVSGSLKFATDITLPGMLTGKILRSPYPHARIVSIDTSRAEALPGVEAILTHQDVPQEEWQERSFNYLGRVLDERVRCVGDEVAAVAAAADAKRQILELASRHLEAKPEDLDIKNGWIFVKQQPEKGIPFAEVVDPVGAFGIKSIGEGASCPTTAAIGQAIYNAVGIKVSPPFTPEKMLKALKEK